MITSNFMRTNSLLALLILLTVVNPVFGDYKISQKTTVEEISTEVTVYSKGVRQRREQKTLFGRDEGDQMAAAMMAKMMPNYTTISQCDRKQNVTLSEEHKLYFVDLYESSESAPERASRLPNQKSVIKGTLTISSVLTDSGKRQEMFGLKARWLKFVTTMETSADSCEGKSDMRLEQEGWFVDLTLTGDSCPIPRTPISEGGGGRGGCQPKLVIKSSQDPGFLLDGTTRTFSNNKLLSTTRLETTALSKATLDQALFEIPKDFIEVESMSELMQRTTQTPSKSGLAQMFRNDLPKGKDLSLIAIDFIAGNKSKLDEDELRRYVSRKVSAAGFTGITIRSQSDILTGNFANVLSLEVKKVKESGASKIGGLFGKVTGNDDGAKLGESEAEIVITIYGKDGKTVTASSAADGRVKGKGTDAVKAAIDKIIGGLLRKLE